ncbi:hypothetical protein A6B43_07315 [Vespertiliibacter pulmonis]|uniref:UPF0208 membrane protein YfbV n=1 Tax=Vespertiliibacter pulmonis TaxID=1443036 RepID=A0A3N4W3J7_9PAST|nr:terminus macrodomain insulation protein YfbV [Vespertiliibacter pulmonis]QLB21341.1 hypothetical protein A6B43_07315 [Vespertiliibacter pulmonis]RPE85751.1 hypothetical protein EDC46_0131 [Vespertiliibacter pulmonis]
MFTTFKAGQIYLNTLPNQKKLNLFLPDYRIIQLIKLASKIMPAFACFALLWQYSFADSEQVITANATLTALFALSIPFQGLYWLGRRASSPLPLSLLEWHEHLRQQLRNKQYKMAEQAAPSYQDFATLLKLAEKTLGQRYFDEL